MTKILQSIPYPTYTTAERDLLVDVLKNTLINNSDTGNVEEYDGVKWVSNSSAETGGVTISDTYINIKALVDSNSLIPESTYIITDFQTKYTQLETLLVKTGPIEPLTLIAATTNTFYEEVRSGLFPKDEILYDINATTNYYSEPTPLVADKGVITWRKDDKDNNTGYDHRVILWRRNSTDVLTFGLGCYNNTVGLKHIETDYTSSRDNVFGNDCYSNTIGNNCYSNTIRGSFYSNTIRDSFYSNTIGHYFYSNTIGNDFYSNTIGNICYSNTIEDYCYLNTFGDNCYSNTIGNYFYSNTIGNIFNTNTIGYNFYLNNIGNNFNYSTIGNDFQLNTIGNNFNSNTIGTNFYYNTIENDFISNIIGNSLQYNALGNGFQYNEIKYLLTYIDWLNTIPTPTHVYQPYNCTIFKNSANVPRLSYYDENDQLIITDITA